MPPGPWRCAGRNTQEAPAHLAKYDVDASDRDVPQPANQLTHPTDFPVRIRVWLALLFTHMAAATYVHT